MKDKVLYYFYVLIDPRDLLIKYVGRTVDIGNRYRNHIYEARHKNRNKRERWIYSILSEGLFPEIKIVYKELCDIDEAISIEKMLVKKIGKRFELKNSPDNFLGAVLTGTPVHQYTLSGEYINTYHNSNQAYIATGVKDCNISRCCKNGVGAKSAGGYIWSFEKHESVTNYKYDWRRGKGKPIICTDSVGNETEFDTSRKAAESLGLGYKSISSVLTGKRKSVNGFYFKFKQ